MKLRVLARLIQIQRVLVRHGLDEFVAETHLYRPLRFVFMASPWTWFERRKSATRGERLRLALEELGPIFIKLGQALSTRRDLLPPDIAEELAKLQDRVPPFDGAIAKQLIERAYEKPLEKVFSKFDERPLAAASIAQVHVATLHDGPEVIVKVLRPGMKAVIGRDLEVMHALATLAKRNSHEARRLRVDEIVDEYEKTVLDELDLMREAANASQLRRNFEGSPLLHVPAVYWDHCRVNVMVMERICGVTISDMATLRALGANIPMLAENGVKIFFTQVFRHNFFHADMHPGNIFVLVDDPARPRYAAVDFGIVGTLDLRDMHYLAENFLAVFDRNYRRVAELHVESGWVPPSTRVDEMESAIRTVLEPIFNKPLKDISFGTILLRLFDISRRFDMRIQPQLILLQKTLLNVEGLGRDLYPELDIWQTAAPILRDWMRDRLSVRTQLKQFRDHLPALVEVAHALPPLLKVAVQKAQDGKLHIGVQPDDIERLRQQIRDSERRRNLTLAGSALGTVGLLWIGFELAPPGTGWLLLLISAIVLWRTRH
ncbi:MAG: ubiquinone biosynthesis regulatory protein kinase UbiB [Gammaproteobacteria bacterium]|jgi:ubiquinone biosynthesis protein|nr:ubiquinone biosynthesis regulatory protein kinase UbiB [Gammaproteobacteria bacterium]MBM4209073.1 ubiquinone biosynthesis regulatory protein kinase UbiB [Gammaproteobacteria bacterium]MBM4229902.1 ubiquinone biosynthesis regulatory protein kinase UbiB [Gammaproteobacteria bacterium]